MDLSLVGCANSSHVNVDVVQMFQFPPNTNYMLHVKLILVRLGLDGSFFGI